MVSTKAPALHPQHRDAMLSASAWLIVAAAACLWFATLAFRHLLPSDEGRYAEIAREMFTSGDWVTIRYQGFKYFEKPPLQFWATALAYTVFGVGDWQARLWVGLCGLGGAAMCAVAAWRWYGRRVAFFAACALLATPAWIVAAHINSLDVGVAAALTAVLACVLVGLHPAATETQRRRWIWGAWGSVGVAILAKGLIGIVLPGLAVIVYCLSARDWHLWRRLHGPSGLCIMLGVVAPWFLIVSIRNPDFPQFFFIHEHWQRYTSGIHHRGGAWWYFVPQFLVGFLPWLGLAPRMIEATRAEPREAAFRPALFLALWAATVFVFFSLSGSKLPGYIVPLYPPLAILVGLALGRMERRAWSRQIVALLIFAVAGLLATPFVARLGDDAELKAGFQAFAPWLAGGFAWAVVCLWSAHRVNRRDVRLGMAACSLAVFGLISIVLLGHESFGRASSGFALAREAGSVITPEMPFYAVKTLDHTVPYYMRHTAIPVEWKDELEFGIGEEPGRWMPTIEDFKRQWQLPAHAGALMSHGTYETLRQQGLAMFPVVADARRMIVTNFARPLQAPAGAPESLVMTAPTSPPPSATRCADSPGRTEATTPRGCRPASGPATGTRTTGRT